MMQNVKKSIAFFLFLFVSSVLAAQINTGILPASMKANPSVKKLSQVRLTPPNLNVLKVENEENEKNGTMLKIAKILPVNLEPSTSGTWEKSVSGADVWRLSISSQGALGCVVHFSAFELPQGSQFFVYNSDGSVIFGPYTHADNPNRAEYAIGMIYGEEAILEYVAPKAKSLTGEISNVLPNIKISGYSYVYRDVMDFRSTKNVGYGTSEKCEVNVNCSEGDDWRVQQKGVAKIYVVDLVANEGGYCSGTLINNTKNDGTPYFLTADHCGGEVTAASFNQWIFYFNYESAGCSNAQPTKVTAITGCTRKSRAPLNGGSDFLFLQLNTTANTIAEFGGVYNGWDKGTEATTGGVCIHHPSGDIKKISTYTKKPTSSTYYGKDENDKDETGITNAHWSVFWSATTNGTGVTEGGSSGSPLFNNQGLVIGTLSGGGSDCSHLTDDDLYGKMSYHWTANGSTDALRLQPWLDPNNTSSTCPYFDPNEGFNVRPDSLVFETIAGNKTIAVKAKASAVNWSASTDQEWLSVSPTSGKGDNQTTTVTVSVPANTNEEDRTGKISVTHDGETKTVLVRQKGLASIEYGFSYDFEACNEFDVDNFAPCTTIDVDGSETYSIEGTEFINQSYTGSFIAFNPSATTPACDSDWVAHQGNKYGACFAAIMPTDGGNGPNNDWFITPLVYLRSNSQLSFWAKSVTSEYGLERFKVLVSTTDNTTGSFTPISTGSYVEAPAAWTKYTYDLSAYDDQVVYVAIQCVSSDAFAFLIDEINITTTKTNTASKPIFTPAAGTYAKGQTVSLSCNTADAVMYYTLDGTNPDKRSTPYTEPIVLNQTTTIKARAYKAEMDSSVVAIAAYTIITDPVITVTPTTLEFSATSEIKNITVSSMNLTEDIQVSVTSGFTANVETIAKNTKDQVLAITFTGNESASGMLTLQSGTTQKIINLNAVILSGILCNDSFEEWESGKPKCWFGTKTSIAASNIAQSTNAHSGTYALQLKNQGTTHKRFTSAAVSVEAKTYYLSYWVKGSGDIRTCVYDDRVASNGYAEYNAYHSVNSDTYVQFTDEVDVINASDQAEFIFSVRNTVESAGHLLLDDVIITIPSDAMQILSTDISDFDIYPNPADLYVQVTLKNAELLQIFDISGRLMQTKNVEKGITSAIYVGNLPVGIYYVKAGTTVKKLIRK